MPEVPAIQAGEPEGRRAKGEGAVIHSFPLPEGNKADLAGGALEMKDYMFYIVFGLFLIMFGIGYLLGLQHGV